MVRRGLILGGSNHVCSCRVSSVRVVSFALRSPTLQQVIPPTLSGFGSSPFFAHRQTVGADTENSRCTVGKRTRALLGNSSKFIDSPEVA